MTLLFVNALFAGHTIMSWDISHQYIIASVMIVAFISSLNLNKKLNHGRENNVYNYQCVWGYDAWN